MFNPRVPAVSIEASSSNLPAPHLSAFDFNAALDANMANHTSDPFQRLEQTYAQLKNQTQHILNGTFQFQSNEAVLSYKNLSLQFRRDVIDTLNARKKNIEAMLPNREHQRHVHSGSFDNPEMNWLSTQKTVSFNHIQKLKNEINNILLQTPDISALHLKSELDQGSHTAFIQKNTNPEGKRILFENFKKLEAQIAAIQTINKDIFEHGEQIHYLDSSISDLHSAAQSQHSLEASEKFSTHSAYIASYETVKSDLALLADRGQGLPSEKTFNAIRAREKRHHIIHLNYLRALAEPVREFVRLYNAQDDTIKSQISEYKKIIEALSVIETAIALQESTPTPSAGYDYFKEKYNSDHNIFQKLQTWNQIFEDNKNFVIYIENTIIPLTNNSTRRIYEHNSNSLANIDNDLMSQF